MYISISYVYLEREREEGLCQCSAACWHTSPSSHAIQGFRSTGCADQTCHKPDSRPNILTRCTTESYITFLNCWCRRLMAPRPSLFRSFQEDGPFKIGLDFLKEAGLLAARCSDVLMSCTFWPHEQSLEFVSRALITATICRLDSFWNTIKISTLSIWRFP